MGGNSPRSQGIGSELRAARTAAGLYGYQLAAEMGVAKSTISRWETGEHRITVSELTRYLLACGASPSLIAELVDAVTKPEEEQWLAVDIRDQKRQQAAMLEIEKNATRISSVSPMLITGILQTSEYTRALMREADVPLDDIEGRVVIRQGRRSAITERRAQLESFMCETALRSGIGSPGVRRRQLEFLLEEADRDNVDIRIIPESAHWHPGMDGQFTLLETANARAVHIENRISALFLHVDDHVKVYLDALDKVREAAMSPADSKGLIADVITQASTRGQHEYT